MNRVCVEVMRGSVQVVLLILVFFRNDFWKLEQVFLEMMFFVGYRSLLFMKLVNGLLLQMFGVLFVWILVEMIFLRLFQDWILSLILMLGLVFLNLLMMVFQLVLVLLEQLGMSRLRVVDFFLFLLLLDDLLNLYEVSESVVMVVMVVVLNCSDFFMCIVFFIVSDYFVVVGLFWRGVWCIVVSILCDGVW